MKRAMRRAWREDIRYRKKHRMGANDKVAATYHPGDSSPTDGLDLSVLKPLGEKIYDIAFAHGWYAEERTFGDRIALCHSELSEALEEFRAGHHFTEIYYVHDKECPDPSEAPATHCQNCIAKPEGIPIELADTMIRILDMAAAENIDLAEAIAIKVAYNNTRPYRHGQKAL